MIKVFGQADTSFISNGDVVLRPLKAKIHKQDNGDYYLDLETGLDYVDYIVEDKIVVADTPQGYQAFRINNVKKTKSKLSTRAWHIFYDAENYLIEEAEITEEDCNEALDVLNAATEPQSPFTVSSDVQAVNSLTVNKTSLYEAIKAVLGKWGGHLVRDNFDIQIKETIGQDNGVTVRYKKNLKDISCEENWNNVVTKLLPVGKEGILLNAVDSSASIYVESTTQYQIPYVKSLTFNQDIDRSDYPTEAAYKQALVADLLQQAQAYVATNCLPQVNYTIKANLEKITDIGDTVEVIDERLGVDIMTHVISFDYDCLLDRYTEIEFGNFQESISGLVGHINAQIQASSNKMGQQLQDTAEYLAQGIGEAYFHAGDTVTLGKYDSSNAIIMAGILTSSSKKIIFSLPLPKYINGLGVTLTKMRLNVRHVGGGYCMGGGYINGGYDVMADSTITVTITLSSDNLITFCLEKTTAFTGTTNTPVGVQIHDISLSFA